MKRRRCWCRVSTQNGEVRVYLVVDPVDDESRYVDGLYDPGKGEILINAALSEERQKMTLLHELLHVVWSGIGGELKTKLLGCKPNQTHSHEETIVSFQEPVLYDLLARNGWLRLPKPPKPRAKT